MSLFVLLYCCESAPQTHPLKMISFRPREVTIRSCLHLYVHECVHTPLRLPLKKRKRPLSIESVLAASRPLVNQDSEWEERKGERREGEDKENGCKRFGSWYLALRRLKTLRVYFRGRVVPRNKSYPPKTFATSSLYTQYYMYSHREILWHTDRHAKTKNFSSSPGEFCGGGRGLGNYPLFR